MVRVGVDAAVGAPGAPIDKRQAILAGAMRLFARDGYSRASIDAIAEEAEVSTRTIYNHFDDKAQLFRTVTVDSATLVAEAQIAILDRHLHDVSDIEAALVEFARAWLMTTWEYAEHFALGRQVHAETAHMPPAWIRAWRKAGPLRVRQELARRLQQLADLGLLRIDDPDRAALHFSQLVSLTDPAGGRTARTDAEITDLVTSGVRAFLDGYRGREMRTQKLVNGP
jgi:AcrR family transcriptional regulator